MKRLNTGNGKSEFFTYIVQENIQETKADPFEEINARLANIENLIGGRYDKSISVDAEPYGGDTGTNAGKNAESKSTDVQPSFANDKRKNGRPAKGNGNEYSEGQEN